MYLGRETINWGITPIHWLCGCILLMNDWCERPSPLWVVFFLVRWFRMLQEDWLWASHREQTNQQCSSVVSAWGSCPAWCIVTQKYKPNKHPWFSCLGFPNTGTTVSSRHLTGWVFSSQWQIPKRNIYLGSQSLTSPRSSGQSRVSWQQHHLIE